MKNVKSLICGLAITLLVLMLPGNALASPGDQGTTITVGGYQVSLGFVEPAQAGTNSIHVTILDEMGMPVSNAQVEISAMQVNETDEHEGDIQHNEPDMGGMEGMDPPAPTAVPTESMHSVESVHGVEETANDNQHEETVTAILEPGHEAGEYAGEITFSNTGHWMLTVHFSMDGETLEADFPLEVTGGSPSGGILAGFAGLNVVLIGVAAITRRKPATA